MKDLRVAVFEKRNPYAAYTMGLEFADSIKRSGAVFVLKVSFIDFIKKYGLNLGLEKIKKELYSFKINTLIFSLDNCFDLPPEFFYHLRPKIFCCLYLGDDEHYFDRSARYYAQCFDLVLPSNPMSVYRYKYYGVESFFLPSCFNLEDFKSIQKVNCEDVVFIGSISGKIKREEYINFLEKSRIDFGSYGASSAKGIVNRKKMYSLFNSAKISLNFTGVFKRTPIDFDISINRRIRGVKGRCQEIALCGGFVLTEYVPGIENMFEIGKEIDVFDSEDELKEKINFYLNNPLIRNQMTKLAHIKAKKLYSDEKVWKDVGKFIHKRKKNHNEKKPIYFDAIFKKSYSSFQLSRLIGLILSFKFRLFIKDLKVLNSLIFPNKRLLIHYLKIELYIPLVRYIKNIKLKK